MKIFYVPVYVRMVEDHMIVDRLKEFTLPASSRLEAAKRVGWHIYKMGWPYEIREKLIEITK